MSSKKISFSIPDYIYDHYRSYLDQFNLNEISVDDFIKGLATNRAIDKNILNEFGMPNEFVIFPKLSFDIPKNPFGVNDVTKTTFEN